MLKKTTLKFIKLYQFFVSPFLGFHCRFFPSCSQYAERAIKKHGLIKGLKKGFFRILKCSPFNKGGVDLP